MLLRYLSALNSARTILWCYFIWWFTTALRCFDPSPRLWLTSVGLSGIIGCGLYLSTAQGATKLGRWQIFRLFLMPFCVSSFAALIKDKGYVLIFSSRLEDNLQSSLLCVTFVGIVLLSKRMKRASAGSSLTPAPSSSRA
jgi:hypothetical protein